MTLSQGEMERARGPFFVFVATTLERLILGLRPLPGGGEGRMTYASVDHSPRAILAAVPDVLRRRLAPGRGRSVARADSLRLNFSGAYTIDGEMYDASAERSLVLDSRDTLRFIRLPA
jgi:hypothetical protein